MTVIETVTSPAGDQVDVTDEVDVKALWGNTGPIVRALWHDGPFRDAGGEAARPLYNAAKRRGYYAVQMSSMSGLLRGSLGPYVEREISGKRTFGVRLARIPKIWLDGRLDENHIPLTREERSAQRQVECPLCGKAMGLNNIHRHLTGRHAQSHSDATRLVRVARRGAVAMAPSVNLPALVEDDEQEPESVMNDIPAIDLMTGMLGALRRDNKVPIDALPTLQEWLVQTERVIQELARHDY